MPDFLSSNTSNLLGQSFVYDDAKLGTVPSLLGEYGNGGATLGTAWQEYLWLIGSLLIVVLTVSLGFT